MVKQPQHIKSAYLPLPRADLSFHLCLHRKIPTPLHGMEHKHRAGLSTVEMFIWEEKERDAGEFPVSERRAEEVIKPTHSRMRQSAIQGKCRRAEVCPDVWPNKIAVIVLWGPLWLSVGWQFMLLKSRCKGRASVRRFCCFWTFQSKNGDTCCQNRRCEWIFSRKCSHIWSAIDSTPTLQVRSPVQLKCYVVKMWSKS